jgi:N-acetylneuraminic acid mutarotase
MANISRPNRTIILLAALMLLAVPIPNQDANAGSAWIDGLTDHANGTKVNVHSGPEGLTLDYAGLPKSNSWSPMSSQPSTRSGQAIVYDAAHAEMVLFGGNAGGLPLGDTWAYNFTTNRWTNMSPPVSPPARYDHAMCYDSSLGAVILFGGSANYNTDLNDTWVYNLTINRWMWRECPGAPGPLSSHFMFYDSMRALTYLFMGKEIWTFDSANSAWMNVEPKNATSSIYGCEMVFDSNQDRFVQFAEDPANYTRGETRVYDPAANEWTSMAPAQNPCGRYHHKMAYDSINGKTVLFGGRSNKYPNDLLYDTWSYDLSANLWTNLNPQTMPTTPDGPVMAFDQRHGEVVLSGGADSAGLRNDLWSYNITLNNWTKRSDRPAARDGHAMVYDSAWSNIVLFGGWNSGTCFNDTWTYNVTANTWKEMHPPLAPEPRVNHAMVYDEMRHETILFSGLYGSDRWQDTWTYNQTTDTWTDKAPAAMPPPRAFHAMAYDRKNGVAILFGGTGQNNVLSDTWAYDPGANKWTEMKPAQSPTARDSHAMAYDPDGGRIVLFGGNGFGGIIFSDTWGYDFNKNAWSNLNIARSGAYGAPMVYDGRNSRIIMFGGTYQTAFEASYYNKSWACDFTASKWSVIDTPTAPQARAFHSMACDEAHGRIVMFGGWNGTGFLDDAWTLSTRSYVSSGYYNSEARDSGGSAHFGTLWWDAVVPWGTLLRFQVQAADTFDDLQAREFIGPDGTNGSFYEVTGQQINTLNNGHRFFQYRAFLGTDDPSESPALRNVNVQYNLMHDVQLVSPAGGESWTGLQNITWAAADPDGNLLSFDIDIIDANGTATALASGLASMSWQWDTTGLPDGRYRIQIVARDNNPSIPLTDDAISGDFDIRHPAPPVNHPPRITSLPPTNATEGEPYTYNVTAFDPDNDPLAYSLGSPVQGIAIDPVSGRLSWTPDIAGANPLLVRVSDGRGGTGEQAFCVTVVRAPPKCSIKYPDDGAKVSGNITITGIAGKGFRALQRVEIQLDGGNWTPAERLENWTLVLDTGNLGDGRHVIRARAFDGRYYSENATVTITVDNAAPNPPMPPRLPEDVSVAENVCPWMILVAVILTIGVSAALYNRTRKSG